VSLDAPVVLLILASSVVTFLILLFNLLADYRLVLTDELGLFAASSDGCGYSILWVFFPEAIVLCVST
jgi:hypothetical protein